ncbi:AMP-binding protein [bacterium]|nr:AMP-binding protein [bacterium]
MGEGLTVLSIFDVLGADGEAPAIFCVRKDGVEVWTRARLCDAALRFAGGLAARGVARGDVIALFCEPRPEAVAAALGTFSAGAVLLLVDVQLADPALAHVLSDSGARLVATTSDHAARLQRLELPHPPEQILLDLDDAHFVLAQRLVSSRPQAVSRDAAPAQQPVSPARVNPDDRAALFYTSGTTGPPKGVPLSHRNLGAELTVLKESGLIRPDDRLLLPLPLHHVYPFVVGLLAPLSLGVPVVLPYALTGPQILRAIREAESTAIIGVPRLYSAMVAGIEAKLRATGMAGRIMLILWRLCTAVRQRFGFLWGRRILAPLHRQLGPSLRVLASGGSPLDIEVARNLEGLGWPIAIGYGLTETSPLLTLKAPGVGPLESVGLPVPGVELRLAPIEPEDAGSGTPAPDGAPLLGEVQARGPNVFAGYLNLPGDTARAFTRDGWFRTGDLGRFDEVGYLYVSGRASTLIIMEGGENVQPEEVERAYEASPIIGEIGVLQREGKLVAVVVPESEQIRDEARGYEEVRQAMTEIGRKLPSYQRVYDFVLSRQAIARTRLGKIQRHVLPRQYDAARAGREQAVAAGPISIDEMSDQDQALLEHRAARVVWDILVERYSEKRLTPDTSPQLELGVDSLTWLDLTMEISQRAGVELMEDAIARVETVRDLLAETLEAAEGALVGGEVFSLENPESLISDAQKRWLRPLPWYLVIVAWIVYCVNRVIFRICYRLKVEGMENLGDAGPMVLAPNHVSFLDAPVVGASIPFKRLRGVYWAAWTGIVLSNAFLRGISRLAQVLPIEPERGAGSSLAFGAYVLKERKTLIWFPEGHRSVSGRLTDFKPGLGMVLAAHPARVIPVRIAGAYEAWPPTRRWPRTGRITVTFGGPIDSRQLEREGEGRTPHERIMSALRKRMEAM